MSFFSPLGAPPGAPLGNDSVIVKLAEQTGHDDGGFVRGENIVEIFSQPLWWETNMLPEPLRHNSGHGGSHTFITHEFIDSLIHSRQPIVNIYEAIAYTAPGTLRTNQH